VLKVFRQLGQRASTAPSSTFVPAQRERLSGLPRRARQSAGGVTLTVDSQTQIMRRGHPVSSGVTSIREGEQVRASFDPASNRADKDKIEVMGKAKMKHHKSAADAPPVNPDGK
jgi:hypothetical protein